MMRPVSVRPAWIARFPARFSSRLCQSAFLFLILSACLSGAAPNPLDRVPPRPLREFRGAWIATVANLDWPSAPGLSTADQKTELTRLLDKAVQMNLNVVIFQVRPACDALYASRFEPWSEFLTGQMGRGPNPFYDPLSFAIKEAHRRGLELHAWFNPFRVRAPNGKSGPATNHVLRTHPEFIRSHGSQLWLDPGLKDARDHSVRVILDVVKRYDIDGVHLDDYFYPYPERNSAGQLLEFPDQPAWQQYQAAGGKLARPDWRRKNIDDFIQGLHRQIKAEKPWVKFGISPFGIWRLGFPAQLKKGLDAYEHLYSDSRKWLAEGWVDYFAPQLYWSLHGPDQSYATLLNWWSAQNPKERLLTPGNNLTKVGDQWTAGEVVNQILQTRKQSGTSGNIFWNITSLMRNNDKLADTIRQTLYAQPALIPPCPWASQGPAPAKPKLQFHDKGPKKGTLSWSTVHDAAVARWFCQIRHRGRWTSVILPRDQTSYPVPPRQSPDYPELIALTAVNRYGMAGATAVLELPGAAQGKR